MVTQSKNKKAQKWRNEHPDYHIQNYEKKKDLFKVRRFNKLHAADLPDDAIAVINTRQEGLCADCGEPLGTGQRTYLFTNSAIARPSLYKADIVCLACRRERNRSIMVPETGMLDEEY